MNLYTEKKIMDLENRLVVAWGRGREWEGLGAQVGHRHSIYGSAYKIGRLFKKKNTR